MGFFVGAFLSAYVEHEGRLILPNVRGKGAAPPPRSVVSAAVAVAFAVSVAAAGGRAALVLPVLQQ